MNIAIYGLRAPDDDTIRYVGQTGRPERRLKKHIRDARCGKHYPVCQWIRDLLSKGQEPVMVILDPDAYRFNNAKEAAWMCEMGKISPLLNVNVRRRPDTILDFAGLKRFIEKHKARDAESRRYMQQSKEQQESAPAPVAPPARVETDAVPENAAVAGGALLAEATDAAKGDNFDLWWKANGTHFVKSIHCGIIRWTHQSKADPTP